MPSRSQVRISSSPLGAIDLDAVDGQPHVPSGTGRVSVFSRGAMVMRGLRVSSASCSGWATAGWLGDQVEELLAEVLDARW